MQIRWLKTKHPFSSPVFKASLASAFALLGLLACATSPTGRKQLLLVGDDQMNQMGATAFQEMKGQTGTNSDPALNAYVRCVADPVAAMAKEQAKVSNWEVVVFKDPTPNAFALPGGKIGVHEGLLKVAKTPGQLAAVLGHEVGHVIAKHSAERVSQHTATQGGLGLIGAFISGGKSSTKGQLLMSALGLGAQVGVLLPYGRTQESEADIIGEDLMARAGFDPRESIDLWRNMSAASGGGKPPEFLSTHPADESRIKNLTGHLPEASAIFERAKSSGQHPQCRL